MNNNIRCIMFASRLNFVVMPYGVHLVPSCSAFNEVCSTVENNYEMVSFLNVVTGATGQNKLIYDEQPAYDKAKDLVADL